MILHIHRLYKVIDSLCFYRMLFDMFINLDFHLNVPIISGRDMLL